MRFALVLLILFVSCDNGTPGQTGTPLHIAAAGPLHSEDAEGRGFYQAAELFVEDINSQGGILGHPLVIDYYNDNNRKETAREVSQEIADSEALAVVGHWYSSCSLAAGEVYSQRGIPAVSPGSTSDYLTIDNPWYFRTVYNNSFQGEFIVRYAQSITGENRVSLVCEEDDYGQNLLESIMAAGQMEGVEYSLIASYPGDLIDDKIPEIAESAAAGGDIGSLILCVRSDTGARLLYTLREKGFSGRVFMPDSCAGSNFRKELSSLLEKKWIPGIYSNSFIATPYMAELAGSLSLSFRNRYKKRFKEEPNWAAVYSYDALLTLCEGLKRSGTLDGKTTEEIRLALRNELEAMNSGEKGVEGITGRNFFDEKGDVIKSLIMGRPGEEGLGAALIQLQPAYDLKKITPGDLQDARVLKIQNRYFYRTHIVLSGVQFNKVENINLEEETCDIDFDIWFRYQGDLDMGHIEFPGTSEEIDLGEPRFQDKQGDVTYTLYSLHGRFKMDVFPGRVSAGEHIAGISWKHKNLSARNLIFTGDDTDGDRGDLLSAATGWKTTGTDMFPGEVLSLSLLNPDSIDTGRVPFSTMTRTLRIEETSFSILDLIIPSMAPLVILFSLFILIVLFLLEKKKILVSFVKGKALKLTLVTAILLSLEVLIIKKLLSGVGIYYVDLTVKIFDTLWWLIPAVFLTLFTENFVWKPLEQKSGNIIPRIIRQFVAFMIYLLAVMCIIAFVFDHEVTSLLATSGVVAMIIGLAIQLNISNIFSGIFINMENSFKIGDEIEVNQYTGTVTDISWRTTKLRSLDGNLISIPNHYVAKETIINHYLPDKKRRVHLVVPVDPSFNPGQVEKILLDALYSLKKVHRTPKPFVRHMGVSDWSVDYRVEAWVNAREYFPLRNQIWKAVWMHLHSSGIPPAVMRQKLTFEKGEPKVIPLSPRELLDHIDIFDDFTSDEKLSLAEGMIQISLEEEDIIVEEEDRDTSLFIIAEGVVAATVKSRDNKELEVARLGAGSFFGELALLTGEPRSATIKCLSRSLVYELKKETVSPLLEKNSRIREKLSLILARRQMENNSIKDQRHNKEEVKRSLANKILKNMQTFFGF